MTKKLRQQVTFTLPISHFVTEGPPPRDPANLRAMRKELSRLAVSLRSEKGGASGLRQLLIDSTSEEHWEVPG